MDVQAHDMTAFGSQPVGDGSANTLCCAGNDGARTGQPLGDGSRLAGVVLVCLFHETPAPVGGVPRSHPQRPSTGTAAVPPELRRARLLGWPAAVHRLPDVLGTAAAGAEG